jgi:uncharacterized protein (DUF58 family)
LRQQDAVGLATFDSQVRTLLRPGGTPSQLNELLQALEEVAPTNKTAAGPTFHELARRLTRRGVVIILSDCFDDVAAIAAGLKHFRYWRHDVTLLHVLDRRRLTFHFTDRWSSRAWRRYREWRRIRGHSRRLSSRIQPFRLVSRASLPANTLTISCCGPISRWMSL